MGFLGFSSFCFSLSVNSIEEGEKREKRAY